MIVARSFGIDLRKNSLKAPGIDLVFLLAALFDIRQRHRPAVAFWRRVAVKKNELFEPLDAFDRLCRVF